MAKRKPPRHICPICHRPRTQPGLPLTVPLAIPTYWSPDEALAIFELVDELRDLIAAIYGHHINDAARRHYKPRPSRRLIVPEEDLPF